MVNLSSPSLNLWRAEANNLSDATPGQFPTNSNFRYEIFLRYAYSWGLSLVRCFGAECVALG